MAGFADFEAGDVVQLKSGGPKMTVVRVGDDEDGNWDAYCIWYEGATKRAETMPFAALKKHDEADKA